jgi:Na+-driven multidrug efflux pump
MDQHFLPEAEPVAAATSTEGRTTVVSVADAVVVKAAPFSLSNEVRFFVSRGLPLCLSALLEWGAPPLVAMFFAGATPDSEELQAALGYGRLFFNCTLLLVIIGAGSYCWSVIPGCIGAGRQDRIPTYFRRAVLLTLALTTPSFLLQFVAEPLMLALSVPPGVAAAAARYCRLMTATAALLLIEMHVEIIFVSSGYARCATFNSLLTGLCADVALSYVIIYRLNMGVAGCALVSVCVRSARLGMWALLACYLGLWPLFLGVKGRPPVGARIAPLLLVDDQAEAPLHANTGSAGADSGGADAGMGSADEGSGGAGAGMRSASGGSGGADVRMGSACSNHGAGGGGAGLTAAEGGAFQPFQPPQRERLLSWREAREFCALALPSVGVNLSGWLTFELQMLALTNVRGVSDADLAAGAIWIQAEQALSAAQTGWIQALSMRVLMLLAAGDPSGARRSFAFLLILAALLVAVTTSLPIVLLSRPACRLASNDADVVSSLDNIFWVLSPQAQSRVLSITATALLIPIGRARLQLGATFTFFYFVATPLTVLLALTDIATDNVVFKMIVCVSTTTVAQLPLALFALGYMARLDWRAVSRVIGSRANTDRLSSEAVCRPSAAADSA